jgi:molybdate transport system ATP-binding protein
LNVLAATVEDVAYGEGPGALVRLRAGDDAILARITRRSAESLGLAPGAQCHVILKSMAIAREQVSQGFVTAGRSGS